MRDSAKTARNQQAPPILSAVRPELVEGLPEGWIALPLQCVAVPTSDRVNPRTKAHLPYVGMEHVEAHTNRLIATVPSTSVSSSSAHFHSGDVLYGRMRPYLNKVARLPFEGLASAEFMVFAETELLDNRLLLFRLSSPDFVEFACSQNSGDRPRVKFEQIADFSLSIPPRTEQTRIVEKLEELLSDLDAGVAELKAAQKKLAQYRQALLKAAVEGSLTATWRETQPAPSPQPLPLEGGGARTMPLRSRKSSANSAPLSPGGRGAGGEGEGGYTAASRMNSRYLSSESGAQLLARILTERRKRWEAKQLAKFADTGKAPPKDWQSKYIEPITPDTTDLPALPEGWAWATIDQLAHVGTGVTPLRSKSAYFIDGTVPWVTSGALNSETVSVATEMVTEVALKECRLELYPPGSLLVAMYGEGKTRGKCSELLISATINQAIAAIVWEAESLSCKPYIKAFLLKSYEMMRGQASGGVQPNLNLQIIKSLVIPLPPVAEQRAIVEQLALLFDQIDLQRRAVDLGLKQSTAQRKNILKAAFSGQLVPQDPNDEPASVLLARIRAERVAEPTRRAKKIVRIKI